MNVSYEDCVTYTPPPYWIYFIKAFIGCIVIVENTILFVAIVRNWDTLTRQHNLYRYLLSLVAADLLNGIILLLHAIYWLLHLIFVGSVNFTGESPQEVFRNLISGVLNGSIFASLASATLLNLVLRVSSNRALARAAAITTRAPVGGATWERSPKITWALIGVIWSVTVGFILTPLRHHCHMELTQCYDGEGFRVMEGNTLVNPHDEPSSYDCSTMRPPSRVSYILILNICNTLVWSLMFLCNLITSCVATKVERDDVSGNLKLRHTFGMSRDSSSFFACVITLSMTSSSVPYIVYSFITEFGSPATRIHYGAKFPALVTEGFELITYLSCIMNPIIYTAMLSHLRSKVSTLIERRGDNKV
nr:uncharacterized protein LOC100181102 [Ciona intestinalis]|eukprot:XP_018672644.2 uncharacterized protein LOC100181102 [Ciona intestinalis]